MPSGSSVGAPAYTGFVQARRVGLRNLLEGVDLTDGELRVALEGDTARVETFTLRGGEGRITGEGSARLGAQPQLQLSARAERLRVLGRVDRQLVLSGQAALTAAADRLRLDGRIAADSGLFDLSRRDAPTLDEDVAVRRGGVEADSREGTVRREPSPRARNTQVALDLDLGPRLRLRGRGLDTGLTGTLRLSAPGGRLALIGTVRAENGTYAAGYEKFVITTVRGLNAKGTWQYRAKPSDPWSDPAPLQFVLTPAPAGGWTVTGADANGIYYGSLDAAGTRLDLAYQGSVNDLVSYAFTMRKK